MAKKYLEDHPTCGMIFIIPKTMSIFESKKYADTYARKLGEKESPLVFDRKILKAKPAAELKEKPEAEQKKESRKDKKSKNKKIDG